MEQLIRELNAPENQSVPQRINDIQREIQRLQRDPSAWEAGLHLLENADSVMRFYGALTITIKVNADWDTDKVGQNRDLVNSLLEKLINAYVRLSAIPDAEFVLSKVSSTLCLVFEKPKAAWSLPCRHVLACSIADRYVHQDQVSDMQSLLRKSEHLQAVRFKATIRLALSIAEEFGQASGSIVGHHVPVLLSNNAPDIWILIHHCLTIFSQSVGLPVRLKDGGFNSTAWTADQISDLVKMVLQMMPYWTSHVKTTQAAKDDDIRSSISGHFTESVDIVLLTLNYEPLAYSSLQTITILVQEHHRLLLQAEPSYFSRVITSSIANKCLKELTSGDVQSEAAVYADFLDAVISQTDCSSPTYLRSDQYDLLFQQTLQLLRCDGIAMIEDTSCRIALEMMSTVAEGYNDWTEPSQYDKNIEEMMITTYAACLNKMQYPEQELNTQTQSWDDDEKAMFEDFRYDVQDFIQTAFVKLGSRIVNPMVEEILKLRSEADWSGFEAIIFSLLSLSDAISNSPEIYAQHLTAILESPLWKRGTASDSTVPGRVRQTIIKFLAENTAFLQRQPDFLVQCLDFLFRSLHVSNIAGSASRAIYTLCDAQRNFLTQALPQFLNALRTVPDLIGSAKYRIFGAVSAIIQALPSEEEKIEPLNQILASLKVDIDTYLNISEDDIDNISKATDVIATLAAIGKGLRAPPDKIVDLASIDQSLKDFWTIGSGSACQAQILHIFSQSFTSVAPDWRDSEMIAAACDFIRTGFTEEHPSPFKFPNHLTADFFNQLLDLENPNLDQTMSTATSFLSSTSATELGDGFQTLFARVVNISDISCKVLQTPSDQRDASFDPPSSILDFASRILPKWSVIWLGLPGNSAIESMSKIIEFAILLLQDSDTLPRRMSASFFASLFEISDPSSGPLIRDPNATHNMTILLDTYSPRIIATILHLLAGECARSELDTLSEPLRKFIAKQALRAKRIMKEAIKPENGILSGRAIEATKPEQRARFVSQVEGLRGARKTNEVVREFWISCKGSSFGYVG